MRRFFKRLTWVLIKRKVKFKAARLKFAFTDYKGNNYYQFENQDVLSPDRLGKLREFYTWLIRGLTNIELDELIAHANQGIVNAIQNIDDKNKVVKNLSNVMAVHAEIQMRSEKISNTELYLNLLAVQYIRHDEDPEIYSESIQKDKVIAFKEASGKLDSFFFALPEYERLCKLLNITTNEWKEFHEFSQMVMQRNQDVKSMLKERLSRTGNNSMSL